MKKNKCVDCGGEVSSKITQRCASCYYKYNCGKNHSAYKGIKHRCVDCNRKLKSRKAKRCLSCHYKSIQGEGNPNWKREFPSCIDCGKKLKNKQAKRCLLCYRKSIRGKGNPNWIREKPNCIDCGKKLASHFTERCHTCNTVYQQGENSSNWKGGPPKCIECGKEIRRFGKRCRACHTKNIRGNQNYHWRGGKAKCVDCSKELSNLHAKRCPQCFLKFSLPRRLGKNKSETFLDKLLQKIIPKEYKYTGLGDFWIERYNPDFVNVNGQKKIIELFGERWHKTEKRIKGDTRKKRVYKKYGYDYLIIWEKDLKKEKTINRILEFDRKGVFKKNG